MSPTSYRAAPPRDLIVTSPTGQGQTSRAFPARPPPTRIKRQELARQYTVADIPSNVLEHPLPISSHTCRLSKVAWCVISLAAGILASQPDLSAQNEHQLPTQRSASTSSRPNQDAETLHSSEPDSADDPEDSGRRVSGLAVIDKMFSRSPELVLRADGYRLRIGPTADLTFRDELNALSDIQTNIWIHYSGEFDSSGAVIVSQATFLPARTGRFFAVPILEVTPLTVELPPAHKEKRRFSQSESRFLAIDDNALQQRVQRIGMSVVPEYQKALPAGDPSKIRFRFYAVDNPRLRAEVCSFEGLILLPKTVVERLKTDDQLAAVLADGVAANLQQQAARLTAAGRMALGVQLAGDVAGAFVPGVGLAAYVGSAVVGGLYTSSLQRQRARIALALLKDAGYDLHQAPEAWRLLIPEKLPSDLKTVKSPSQSRYLERIIDRQYPIASQPSAADSEVRAPAGLYN